MATVLLLMLGSVMSAVVAGNRSVKPLDEPPDEPKVEANSSDFWKKEVERIKQPEPLPTDREPPPLAPVSESLDCDGEWSEWSTCTEECDGGTQFRNYTTFRLPTNGGKKCPPKVQTQACNTVACQRDPVTLYGYTDNGTGVGQSCSGQPLYSSAKWELVNPSEDKVTTTSFDDPYYQKYQRRAAVKCNEDDRCSYLTVTQDGSYKTFSESQCKELRNDVHSTTWKKEDNTLAGKDVPINFSFDPQKINGYTSQSQNKDPPDKFSWRNPKQSDEGVLCKGLGVENSTDVKTQGPEVSFDSDEYKEYVKNVQASCELESDCNYISVNQSGYGIMYKECPADGYRDVAEYKTFKRDDDQPKRIAPPENLGGHDAEFLGYKPVSRYQKCNNGGFALANEFIREEGEEKVNFNDWFSWKHQRLLKRGIALCDKDPNCQYLELDHSGATVRTFKKEDCKHPEAVHFDSKRKIWEKGDWKDPNIQDPVHGYEQYGKKNNSCGFASPKQSGWISQEMVPGSKELGSPGEAESFTKGDQTMDDTYSEYLKQGAMICNGDPNCKYVSVWLDGTYRTFDASACQDQPLLGYEDVKTWKKKDSSVVGTVPPPPPPPPPPEKHGYTNTHTTMMCPMDKQNWIQYSGSTNHGFESSEYDDNLKKGIIKCNDDPKCKYVTAFKDGLTGLVSEGECDSPSPAQNTKIWEKKDPNVIGFSPPPPPPPPPPPFACNGNVNTRIPDSQVNDGTCDCKPGFDDEPETGACKIAERASVINDLRQYSSTLRPKKIKEEVPSITYDYHVAKTWSGGYTAVSDPYAGGYGKYAKKYTAKTQTRTSELSLPYLIREDKSGWTRNVYNGKTFLECQQISRDTNRSPGFTYLTKGLKGEGKPREVNMWSGARGSYTDTVNDDDPVCVVYGKNTGTGTDKKCVEDHVKHEDCRDREPTDLERLAYKYDFTVKPTLWRWGYGGGSAPDWTKDKYWT